MELRIWGAALIVACMACEVSGGARRSERPSSSPPVAPDEVSLVGVSSEVFEDDRLRSRARAAALRLNRKTGRLSASKIEVLRFDPEREEATGRLTADRATGHADRRDLTLEGHVELRDQASRRVITPRAEYTEKDATLRLPEEVQISGENFSAVGASAIYRLDAEKLEVAPPVRAVVVDRGSLRAEMLKQ